MSGLRRLCLMSGSGLNIGIFCVFRRDRFCFSNRAGDPARPHRLRVRSVLTPRVQREHRDQRAKEEKLFAPLHGRRISDKTLARASVAAHSGAQSLRLSSALGRGVILIPQLREKDLSKAAASRMVICVTHAPIVRSLAPLGMTLLMISLPARSVRSRNLPGHR